MNYYIRDEYKIQGLEPVETCIESDNHHWMMEIDEDGDEDDCDNSIEVTRFPMRIRDIVSAPF